MWQVAVEGTRELYNTIEAIKDNKGGYKITEGSRGKERGQRRATEDKREQ